MPAPYCQPEAEKIRVWNSAWLCSWGGWGANTWHRVRSCCLGYVLFSAVFCLASAVEENWEVCVLRLGQGQVRSILAARNLTLSLVVTWTRELDTGRVIGQTGVGLDSFEIPQPFMLCLDEWHGSHPAFIWLIPLLGDISSSRGGVTYYH